MSVIFLPVILGRKWLRQFCGRLAFFGVFCWKTPMPIKFLLLGRGGARGFFGRGGGSANFIFMGVGIVPTSELCVLQFFLVKTQRRALYGPMPM